jgi:hypothetical protein
MFAWGGICKISPKAKEMYRADKPHRKKSPLQNIAVISAIITKILPQRLVH